MSQVRVTDIGVLEGSRDVSTHLLLGAATSFQSSHHNFALNRLACLDVNDTVVFGRTAVPISLLHLPGLFHLSSLGNRSGLLS